MAASWGEQSGSDVLDEIGEEPPRPARWSGAMSDTLSKPALRRGQKLGRAVEAQVVPRLLLGHRVAPARAAPSGGWEVEAYNVAELARCAVTEDGAAGDYVASVRARGAAVEAVYLDLLAPAARRLGEQWEDDTLSFFDVSIGLLRLHQVLRALAPEFRLEAAPERVGRRALLVPAPGEQHSFGLAMVTEFMRRAGWSVWSGTPDSFDQLISLVRGEWFAVIGFSVACSDRLDTLSACIRRVRAASRNPAVGVMVGGPIFIAHPDLSFAVGADATAKDGRHAAFQAEGLLSLQPALR